MFKKLLLFAALAFSCSVASAEVTTLWHSDNEEEQSTENWRRVYELTPETAAEYGITAGDYLVVTISYINNVEGGWPQVAVFDTHVGWPPITNEGVGGNETPYVVKFPITNDIYTVMSTNGLNFSGGDVLISDVGFEKGVEVGPFTVWFGNKDCGWGDGVGLAASYFADIQPGAQLKFWTSDQSFQILLGGWSGLNLAAYDGSISNKTTVDGVTTFTMIPEYATTNTYGENELDVFALMKAEGVVMHGTTTLTRIDYIPADYPTISEGGLTTYCPTTHNVIIPDGVTAYTVTIEDSYAKLTKIEASILPKGCGVVLEGTSNSGYSFLATADNADALDASNRMVGATSDIDNLGSKYVLGVKNGECVFGKWVGTVFPAGKAYLDEVPMSSAPLKIVKEDVTGIESVITDQTDNATYNVVGQKVDENYKGLVIKNGQKFVRK